MVRGKKAGVSCLMAVAMCAHAEGDAQTAVSGHAAWQYVAATSNDGEKEGFQNLNASLNIEQALADWVSVDAGLWLTRRLYEQNKGDYKASIEQNQIIYRANLAVDGEAGWQAKVGRQEVDLPWMSDYIEGVSFSFPVGESLELGLWWAVRQAVVDPDEVSDGFADLNDRHGIYVLDARWAINDGLSLGSYYYQSRELFRAPGLLLTGAYTLGNEIEASSSLQWVGVNTGKHMLDEHGIRMGNGGLLGIEQGLSLGDWELGFGYLRVDRNGLGGLELAGDQGPLEEGNLVFAPNAKTSWLLVAYDSGPYFLEAVYGRSRHAVGKENETNLTLGYRISDAMDLGLSHIDVRNADNAESYRMIKSSFAYHF